jgi:L-ribulokinase
MLIAGSSQAPALGAAISAAVTAGEHDSWAGAQAAMTSLNEKQFEPDEEAAKVYDDLYELYKELHDGFGGVAPQSAPQSAMAAVMKELLAIRTWVRQ